MFSFIWRVLLKTLYSLHEPKEEKDVQDNSE